MKKVIYLTLVFFCAMISSCAEEDGPCIPPFCEQYVYDLARGALTADSHNLHLRMTQGAASDWTISDVKVWHGTEVPELIDKSTLKWQQLDVPFLPVHPMNKYYQNGNTFGTEWVKIEKQPGVRGPELKVQIKENDTEYARGIWITFGNPYKDGYIGGYLYIVQKPKPDTTPFTMNIRYKGQMYSTTAQLNLNEEVVYSNPEFGRVMDEIDGLKDVEAMVLEDNIIDYFDLSDSKTRAAVAKINRKVDAATRCNLRTSFPLTRAADAFRFDSPSSLGYFAMFDDSGFSDTNVYACLNSLFEVDDQKYMRDINLNDKVSSLAVAYKGTNPEVCAVLTIWEDSDYNHGDDDRTKHRISIIATKDNPRVSVETLKSIKCINSRNTWNDRISSYSFAFGNYDSHLKNY